MKPLAVGAERCTGDQIRIPPRVVHDHAVASVAVDDHPVPPAGRAMDGAPMQVAAGDGDAAINLPLDRQKIGSLLKPRNDAVVAQGLELGGDIGRVAKPLHRCQILVIPVGPMESAGFQGLQQHRAARREAGAIALAALRRVALRKIGHAGQGV